MCICECEFERGKNLYKFVIFPHFQWRFFVAFAVAVATPWRKWRETRNCTHPPSCSGWGGKGGAGRIKNLTTNDHLLRSAAPGNCTARQQSGHNANGTAPCSVPISHSVENGEKSVPRQPGYPASDSDGERDRLQDSFIMQTRCR